MFTVGYCISIFLITKPAAGIPAPEYEVIHSNNNGWIPLTFGQVYNQGTPITTGYRDTDANNNYLFGPAIATEKTVTREITVKDRHGDKCTYKGQKPCLYTNIEDVTFLNVESDFVPDVFKPDVGTNKTSNQNGRRSKKILDVVFSHNENKEMKSDTDNNVKEKSYEVTEKNESDVQNDATKGLGYFYQPPNNYTTKLFKLLSKYNIKYNDELPNYALSRQHKHFIPVKETLGYKHFDFQVPFRYNSLNHQPVDPLLAVFLSNYGYYLQGQYGIKNKYNNLYGYLASNNMHNNRPFGLYKIFSDTDSL